MNFGQLAVEYYLSKHNNLLNQIKELVVLPAMTDTDGGLGFSHKGNLYMIIVNTFGEFEVSVISKDQDLAYIELGDANELVKFFELLANDTDLQEFAVWFNFLG